MVVGRRGADCGERRREGVGANLQHTRGWECMLAVVPQLSHGRISLMSQPCRPHQAYRRRGKLEAGCGLNKESSKGTHQDSETILAVA
jgi:hypothetical protein